MSETQAQKSKFLIQMSGPPGAGKSTTAKLLASLIDGVVIDHDVIRSSLLDNEIPFYKAAKAAYGLNWALVEALMQQDKTVIVDSPCNYQEILDTGTALAQKYGFEYRYVECRTDDINLLGERLRNRVPMRSQRTSMFKAPRDATAVPSSNGSDQELHGQSELWTKVLCRPDHNVIFVDAAGDLETRGKDLLTRLYSTEPALSAMST